MPVKAHEPGTGGPARHGESLSSPHRRIVPRTSQLPLSSRVLYRIDHYSSLPSIAIAVTAAVAAGVVAGAIVGFTTAWATAFSASSSAVTLVMVFSIQHTQGREQAATQRKLDELLRALPGTEESLIMLEEAPQEVMLEIEEQQRDLRSAVEEAQPPER